MPYKFETDGFKVGKENDKRIKLTEEDREDIRAMYKTGEWSQRKLAREFGVSRRLIQFVLDPSKHEENLRRREDRGGSKYYYDKDKHKEYMKAHREHKKKIYNNLD